MAVSGLGTGAIAGEQLRMSLKKLTKEWQKVLGLDEYNISIDFSPDDNNNVGETAIDSDYLRATIHYNLGDFLNKPELSELVTTVVHELGHVLIVPLTDEIERLQSKLEANGVKMDDADKAIGVKAQEQTLTRLERAIWRISTLSPSLKKRLGLPE